MPRLKKRPTRILHKKKKSGPAKSTAGKAKNRPGKGPKKRIKGNEKPNTKKKKSVRGKKKPDVSKKEPGTKLAVKLDEPKRLGRQLNATVRFIAMKDRKIGSHLEDIGEHIINRYFGKDIKRIRSNSPAKGFSLRKLAEHPRSSMSLSTLKRCVVLAIQRNQLGSGSALSHLSTTHRIALTQVPGRKQKQADIRMIIQQKLSSRAYLQILQERTGKARSRHIIQGGKVEVLSPGRTNKRAVSVPTELVVHVKPLETEEIEEIEVVVSSGGKKKPAKKRPTKTRQSSNQRAPVSPMPFANAAVLRITAESIQRLSPREQAIAKQELKALRAHIDGVLRKLKGERRLGSRH